jgi:starch phosphorylase
VLKDFHEMWPEKIRNKTNGVSPRRFVALANPALAALLEEVVGGDWLRNLEEIRRLESRVGDRAFLERWRAIQRAAKASLSDYIRRLPGVALDPDALFDIQVKRIHEYKRQHLNVLHIISLYSQLKQNPTMDITPRVFIFGGKAAPGYHMAKLIIKLINSVADVINRDSSLHDAIKVVFVPTSASRSASGSIRPADLSEQISTAGKEASGTGNMKFMMNGALTIGTLDGANIEIREAVGEDNFFLFGKTVQQVEATWAAGYRPRSVYEQDEGLRKRHRPDQLGLLLSRRWKSVPPADRQAPERRSLSCMRRLPRLRRVSGPGRAGVSGQGTVVAKVDPQRRAKRSLLGGSRRPRVCRGHLARGEAPGRSLIGAG